MNKRDEAIMDSLKMFRVLDRDQLIELHFSNLKQPTVTCNRVMKRLRDRKLVDCDTTSTPYNYFPNPSPIRKDSMKLLHFKAITNFFIEAAKLGHVAEFEIEFKPGKKGSIEPDLFMIWNNAPFFVEIQRNVYSKKVIDTKMERYRDYFDSEEWKELPWQRSDKKFFPYILIITDHKYHINKPPLKVFEASSMTDFVSKYVKR
jgi:Replication-relaxation